MTIANRSLQLVALAFVIASSILTLVFLYAPVAPQQVQFQIIKSTATASAFTTAAGHSAVYPSQTTLRYPEYQGSAQQTPLALAGASKSPPYPHSPNEGNGRGQVSGPYGGDIPPRGECSNCADSEIPSSTTYLLIPTRVGPIIKVWVLGVALLLLAVALVAALRLATVSHRAARLDDATQQGLKRDKVDLSEATLTTAPDNRDHSSFTRMSASHSKPSWLLLNRPSRISGLHARLVRQSVLASIFGLLTSLLLFPLVLITEAAAVFSSRSYLGMYSDGSMPWYYTHNQVTACRPLNGNSIAQGLRFWTPPSGTECDFRQGAYQKARAHHLAVEGRPLLALLICCWFLFLASLLSTIVVSRQSHIAVKSSASDSAPLGNAPLAFRKPKESEIGKC